MGLGGFLRAFMSFIHIGEFPFSFFLFSGLALVFFGLYSTCAALIPQSWHKIGPYLRHSLPGWDRPSLVSSQHRSWFWMLRLASRKGLTWLRAENGDF